MDSSSSSVDVYNLLAPETRNNPYPVYARLRSEAPVYYAEAWNAWLLTRYQDVLSGFRDKRLSARRTSTYMSHMSEALREKIAPVLRNLASWSLLLDPPAHTRIRSFLNKAFAPRLVDGMQPRIQSLVDGMLDRIEVEGRLDVIRDFAGPLPMMVIASILGVPNEDHHRFKIWSDAITAFTGMDPIPMHVAEETVLCVTEMEDYFRAALEERRRAPRGDLLTNLINVEDQGAKLNEQELLSTCAMVLVAGHETTTNFIGNSIHALLKNPDQIEALREGRAPVEHAVEELLRYDGPVQRMGRAAIEDIEMGAQRIRKGDRVFLLMGAANRDPAQFPDPDRLDFSRTDIRHLSFGMGIHYCVGASLARLEAQSAIPSLIRRFPKLRFSSTEPEWLQNNLARGLTSFPLLFS